MASALHLTVRLQTGQKDDEQEPVEEIGGLINSDGEVTEWDGSELPYSSFLFLSGVKSNVYLLPFLKNF